MDRFIKAAKNADYSKNEDEFFSGRPFILCLRRDLKAFAVNSIARI